MSDFLAKTIKDQTDSILRRMRNSPGSGAIVRGGTTTPGTGAGTPPDITDPTLELDQHKTSGDHDSRYYTEIELNNGQLDTRYYTEDEIDALLEAIPAGSGSFDYGLITDPTNTSQDWGTIA